MTTEAGKRLLQWHFDAAVMCGMPAEGMAKAIKAVEREAVERYAEAMAVGEAAIRRDERARLRERVEGTVATLADVPHDHGVQYPVPTPCTACLRDGLARVLAILEEAK